MNHSQRASIWVLAALFAVGADAQTAVSAMILAALYNPYFLLRN